jgi:hypothetical protein
MGSASPERRGQPDRLGGNPFEGLDAEVQDACRPAVSPADEGTVTGAVQRVGSSSGPDLPVACPYLGVPEDPETYYGVSDEAHVCYRARRLSRIPVAHQGEYCLVGSHKRCPVFVAARGGRRSTPPWDDRPSGGIKGFLQRLFSRG